MKTVFRFRRSGTRAAGMPIQAFTSMAGCQEFRGGVARGHTEGNNVVLKTKGGLENNHEYVVLLQDIKPGGGQDPCAHFYIHHRVPGVEGKSHWSDRIKKTESNWIPKGEFQKKGVLLQDIKSMGRRDPVALLSLNGRVKWLRRGMRGFFWPKDFPRFSAPTNCGQIIFVHKNFTTPKQTLHEKIAQLLGNRLVKTARRTAQRNKRSSHSKKTQTLDFFFQNEQQYFGFSPLISSIPGLK